MEEDWKKKKLCIHWRAACILLIQASASFKRGTIFIDWSS